MEPLLISNIGIMRTKMTSTRIHQIGNQLVWSKFPRALFMKGRPKLAPDTKLCFHDFRAFSRLLLENLHRAKASNICSNHYCFFILLQHVKPSGIFPLFPLVPKLRLCLKQHLTNANQDSRQISPIPRPTWSSRAASLPRLCQPHPRTICWTDGNAIPVLERER